jgi:hypothetical protein
MDQWKLVNIYKPIVMYVIFCVWCFLFQRKLKIPKNKLLILCISLMHVIEY